MALTSIDNHGRLYATLRVKALLPLVGVLLLGIFLFAGVTLSVNGSAREEVIMVAAAGAGAIFAVVVVVLAILIQRPLVELQEKIALLREGDLTVAVSFADRQDEMGDLGRNFNDTVVQLRESREEIQRLHRTQMSKAEHLATLGELAAGLAHEIRNPLAGIAGVIEVIGCDLPETSRGRRVLHEVRHEVVQIERALSDLLAYARPKPQQLQLADLNLTVAQAVKLARQQVVSRPIQVEIEESPQLPLVEHDPVQIEQVMLNLLLNAIQATPGPGRVRVRLGSQNGSALISVKDEGQGIRAEHLANIFRPFFSTKKNGTGLGLSLAHRIVDAHGGRIEVASVPGRGTEFNLWLPVHKPAPEAAGSAKG
ncbi:MAG TPA: ATP-binding protein [Terriglobia bacterium]|nr:ATP-binding protein [Terriglobia bacterium]